MAASLSTLCRSVRLASKLRKSSLRCFAQNSKSDASSSIGESAQTLDLDQGSNIKSSQGSSTNTIVSPSEGALDKFAKVVDKVKKAQDTQFDPKLNAAEPEDPNESFASMFRRSKFVSLGEHKGRLIQGEIIEVMEDDLYIDFGGKFHCVCPRPKRNGDRYHRGSKVLLSLQCMEMSSAFLGSDIDVTLLEADATLLGLAPSQEKRTQRNQSTSQQTAQ